MAVINHRCFLRFLRFINQTARQSIMKKPIMKKPSPPPSKIYALILCVLLSVAILVAQTLFVWGFGLAFGLTVFQASENSLVVSLSLMATALCLITPIIAVFWLKNAHTKPCGTVAHLQMAVRRFAWRDFGWCVLLLGLYLVISETLTRKLHRNPTDFMDALMDGSWRGLLVVVVVLMAPIYEEIVFRGAIFSTLKNAWQTSRHATIIASVLSSLAFAVIHLQYELLEMSMVFGLGLIFCYAKVRTGSLIAPILLHIMNNGLAMLVYLLQRSA